ncbi:hypothetical protein Gpo141_00007895 [Globisporangium polare]
MTDAMLRTLIDAVEFLVPSLHEALKWDPIEFGPIIPEYCTGAVATATTLTEPAPRSDAASLTSSGKEADRQQLKPSRPTPAIA